MSRKFKNNVNQPIKKRLAEVTERASKRLRSSRTMPSWFPGGSSSRSSGADQNLDQIQSLLSELSNAGASNEQGSTPGENEDTATRQLVTAMLNSVSQRVQDAIPSGVSGILTFIPNLNKTYF